MIIEIIDRTGTYLEEVELMRLDEVRSEWNTSHTKSIKILTKEDISIKEYLNKDSQISKNGKKLKKVKIENVVDIEFAEPSEENSYIPRYIKVQKVTAFRDGEKVIWEKIKTHSSVHILVINLEQKEIYLVKQVRVPVLVNDNSQNGEVYEMCAGLLDKDKEPLQIAQEEILEEVGYNVPLSNIKPIKKIKSAVGISGSDSHCFIAYVEEKYKETDGGGLESEDIEVVKIPFTKVYDWYMNNTNHTDAVTMYLMSYFLLTQKE
jgi:UDP-sugar diphosphatase